MENTCGLWVGTGPHHGLALRCVGLYVGTCIGPVMLSTCRDKCMYTHRYMGHVGGGCADLVVSL